MRNNGIEFQNFEELKEFIESFLKDENSSSYRIGDVKDVEKRFKKLPNLIRFEDKLMDWLGNNLTLKMMAKTSLILSPFYIIGSLFDIKVFNILSGLSIGGAYGITFTYFLYLMVYDKRTKSKEYNKITNQLAGIDAMIIYIKNNPKEFKKGDVTNLINLREKIEKGEWG